MLNSATRSALDHSAFMQPLVFMFSGQGSQYYQMGRDLYHDDAVFERELSALDRLARERIGISLVSYMYQDSRAAGEPFTDLLHSHTAIFMVEYAMFKTLQAYGIHPDYVLGASLGELCALAAAGVLDVAQAFDAVVHQALVALQHCEPAGMLAILAEPALLARDPLLRARCELAGVSAPAHIVVAAEQFHVSTIVEHLKESRLHYQVLPTDRGFHSSLVAPARGPILSYSRRLQRGAPRCALVSCVRGTTDPLAPEHLWRVVREPIDFMHAITNLEARGAHTYLDLGPSGTLATFVKYNLAPRSSSRYSPLLSPFGGSLARLAACRQHQQALRSAPASALLDLQDSR